MSSTVWLLLWGGRDCKMLKSTSRPSVHKRCYIPLNTKNCQWGSRLFYWRGLGLQATVNNHRSNFKYARILYYSWKPKCSYNAYRVFLSLSFRMSVSNMQVVNKENLHLLAAASAKRQHNRHTLWCFEFIVIF